MFFCKRGITLEYFDLTVSHKNDGVHIYMHDAVGIMCTKFHSNDLKTVYEKKSLRHNISSTDQSPQFHKLGI